jgi:hypothetical protein
MELDFKEQPRIGNCSDALELLDQLFTTEVGWPRLCWR